MKLVLLLCATVSLSFSLLSQSVYSTFQSFKKDSELKNASIGFMAVDIESGDTILINNPNVSLPSASTAKLFSTASAIELLGPNYQPKTKIFIDGTISSEGILTGDIIIQGGGDASLGSKYFNAPENRGAFLTTITSAIKAKGIQSINGSIISDGSAFGYEGVPDNWAWSDIGNYYGSGASGLMLFDNMLEFHFKTSSRIGGPTTITKTYPEIDSLNVFNYVTSAKSSRDNAYIYGAPYSLDRFITGSIPYNRTDFVVKGSLPDPEKAFGQLLLLELKKNNISFNGTILTGRSLNLVKSPIDYSSKTEIASLKGKTIQTIVNKTNEKSINLFAETLVHLIGREKHSSKLGTNSNGIAVIDGYWRNKINTAGLYLNDGSGLSRSNAISPGHFIQLLSWMSKHENGEIFENSLPIAGETGTLRSVCKKQSAHGKLRAKSGTMRRIKSYAGYINSTSGKKIAFAIIVNNYTCSSRQLVKKMEPIFNALSKY